MNRFARIAATGIFGVMTAVSADAQQKGAGQQGVPSAQGQKGAVGQTNPGQQGVPNAQGQKGTVGQTNPGQQGVYQGGIGQTPWFSNPDIRQQFKLNDQQYNQLNTGYTDQYGRYQKEMTTLGKDLTDAQRTQKMNELQQRFNKDFSSSADKVFTDPQQRQRYNQLHMQYQGYNAFSDPMVQGKLNLNSEQREKLSQYGQEWQTQMNQLGGAYQTDREGATKRFNDMRNQSGERINSVLTPEQQKMWQQMTGESYNFQPSVYFQSGSGTTNNRTPSAPVQK